MECNDNMRLAVALSGASGAIYGIDLIARLLQNYAGANVYCTATHAALDIIGRELLADGVYNAVEARFSHLGKTFEQAHKSRLHIFDADDFDAPIASGSFYFDAMAVSPCSMKTLGKCANSIADNLAIRAAEVALKERRRIVFVVRETPLASTQLSNMLALSNAGAVILPACPAFYNNPQNVDDIVKFVTARTVSAMGLRQNIEGEWGNGA